MGVFPDGGTNARSCGGSSWRFQSSVLDCPDVTNACRRNLAMGRIVGTVVLVAALVLGTWFFIDAATLAITTLERHHPNYLAEQ